jgi:UPF0042 nucleotide-binding protein
LAHQFALDQNGWPFRVRVISFGYKHGVPHDADLVFDVRFLPNPHYVEHLKNLTGDHPDIEDYVMQWPVSQNTLHHLEDLLDFLLPQYRNEGKASVTVAIGCTGGHHRSVVFANRIGEHVRRLGVKAQVEHRDVARQEANA